MGIKEDILAKMDAGPALAGDIMSLGYSRTLLQNQLKILVETGEVYRYGKGKATMYARDKIDEITPKGHVSAHKKVAPLVLPDLPPLMLMWGGYTDIVPDETAGRLIEGGY